MYRFLAWGLGATSGASAIKTVIKSSPSGAQPARISTGSSARSADTSPDPAGSGELPDYQRSAVGSKTAGLTVLAWPDSVSKVEAFYEDALDRGGWQVGSF